MTTKAFLVDLATGETVQRMTAADSELDAFVPTEGLIVVKLGEGAADIEATETYLDGTLKLRERAIDPEIEFAVARVKAREAVNARRELAEGLGCETIAGPVETDQYSQLKLNGAATMALIAKVMGAPFALTWTMADNSIVDLNADTMIAVASAAGVHVAACHEWARVLKAKIEAATAIEQIDAIDIEAGWPGGDAKVQKGSQP